MTKRFILLYLLAFIAIPYTSGCGLEGKIIDALNPETDPNMPVARIDAESTIRVKSNVRLDGSASSDPSDESLTYEWTLAEWPHGSEAEITSSEAVATTFFADKGGYYTVTLKVTNASGVASRVRSLQLSAVGTGENHPPVAIIGTTVSAGFVILDGSGSYDIDGHRITYEWVLLNAPGGSISSITAADQPIAYLSSNATANLAVQLVISDGVDTDKAFVTIDNKP